jgi:hypothetical protein
MSHGFVSGFEHFLDLAMEKRTGREDYRLND